MYYEMISEYQSGNDKILMELIEYFQPLLKKYAFMLGYQDAYNDLQLEFIEFLQKMPLTALNSANDGTIVEYIRVTVVNFYRAEVKKLIKKKNEILMSELSESQQSVVYNRNSGYDDTFLFEYELDKILNAEEKEIIYLIYVLEFTSSDIAKMKYKTRQAINQKKKRALNKIREYIDDI
nr:sigma factor-like helix-turn-helix DNA-binding protein [uncultured Eisenbergiella sp.]